MVTTTTILPVLSSAFLVQNFPFYWVRRDDDGEEMNLEEQEIHHTDSWIGNEQDSIEIIDPNVYLHGLLEMLKLPCYMMEE